MEDIKGLFVQDIGDEDYQTKGLWCTPKGDNHEVANIPFIAKNIALGDVIKVEWDDEESLLFRRTY